MDTDSDPSSLDVNSLAILSLPQLQLAIIFYLKSPVLIVAQQVLVWFFWSAIYSIPVSLIQPLNAPGLQQFHFLTFHTTFNLFWPRC
jgi:hypothetical protein